MAAAMPQYMNNSIEDDMAASAMSLDLLSQSGGVKSGQKRPVVEIEDLNSGDSQLFKVKASYVRPQPVPERPSNPIERLI